MPVEIFVFSDQPLGCARGDLEYDIEDLLGAEGEITGGGSGLGGWNIDIALNEDAAVEEWVGRLAAFLRQWGVPRDTHFEVLPAGWVPGQPSRRVEVFME